MQYRKEIDGLRAVAVVPVVLFHAGFAWIGGGFVGVDVFFVISGYLITSLIVLEMAQGRFSFAGFYERRARRILPALFAMMAASSIAALFLMTPGQLQNFGEASAAVSLFVSNIIFFLHGGYFATDTRLDPLLHTWTLAVEEQYYLLFPIFMLLFWRLGRTTLVAAVAAIALASFAITHLFGSFSSHFPFLRPDWTFAASTTGFYLTPTRAWELMLGALAALFLPGAAMRHGRLSEFAALLGLAAILVAVFTFTEHTPSPSYYILLPSLGTVLIILFATGKTLVGRLLAHPALVGIGLISYSVYLWHQPLFAFARLWRPVSPGGPLVALLALTTLGIGFLSWRYIERPFRDRRHFTRRRIFLYAGTVSLFFLAFGTALALTNGLINRYPPEDRYLLTITQQVESDYVNARFNSAARDFTPGPDRKILIIGDSFAQDLVNMIGESGALSNYQIRTFYIAGACQIVLPPSDATECRKQKATDPVLMARLRQADIVILEASWEPEAATRLKNTLAAMHLQPEQRLFVLGAKNFGSIRPASYAGLPMQARIALRSTAPILPANAILRAEFPPEIFVDVEALMCPNNLCQVFTPDGKLISFDGTHLTPYGAGLFGRRLFGDSVLKELSEG